MNQETIKRLIRLNDGQKLLLDRALDALAALNAAGVLLVLYDYTYHAVNVSSFKNMEVDDDRYEKEYESDGYVQIPFWEADPLQDFVTELCSSGSIYAVVDRDKVDCDTNLFNQ